MIIIVVASHLRSRMGFLGKPVVRLESTEAEIEVAAEIRGTIATTGEVAAADTAAIGLMAVIDLGAAGTAAEEATAATTEEGNTATTGEQAVSTIAATTEEGTTEEVAVGTIAIVTVEVAAIGTITTWVAISIVVAWEVAVGTIAEEASATTS